MNSSDVASEIFDLSMLCVSLLRPRATAGLAVALECLDPTLSTEARLSVDCPESNPTVSVIEFRTLFDCLASQALTFTTFTTQHQQHKEPTTS